MGKENPKTVVFNTFGNLGKKELPNSLLAPTFRKDIKNIVIISTNTYCLVY